MSQSKKHSAYEALTNIVVGILVAFVLNYTVLPLFGFQMTAAKNVGITAIYTVASFARSYLLRRFWNAWHIKNC